MGALRPASICRQAMDNAVSMGRGQRRRADLQLVSLLANCLALRTCLWFHRTKFVGNFFCLFAGELSARGPLRGEGNCSAR